MAGEYIMTLESDAEDDPVKPDKLPANEDTQLDPEFSFDVTSDPYADILGDSSHVADIVQAGSKPQPISVDDIIARRQIRAKRKRQEVEDEGTDDEEHSADSQGDDSDTDDEFAWPDVPDVEDPLSASEGSESDGAMPEEDEEADSAEEDDADGASDDSEPETQAELDRKAAFFDSETTTSDHLTSFLAMNLSRPLIKAITALGYHKPTPIQSATIPVALLGKDVVGNAVTGSGKTAAFIIPMIERLLYREKGKKSAATRCLILVPTRELGVQCLDVGKKLALHTDVDFCLVVGGLSLKSQEAALRNKPDVVIATPGRLIDHIRNSPTFTLDALDILVLDEADRMLSDGFADELTEIVKSCPKSRQTMLFSATMTDSVDELVRLSLDKPVRLFVDPKRTTARGLVQEFVRVRAGKEAERPALLVALCRRTFKSNVIIFLRSKKLAHQMRIVFGLLGMKCEELHGDLTQEQRLRSLQLFRDGSVDFLMATDLASRGLDIKGVETVINYDMPSQLSQYLHRVGRTARAGKQGRSVTLVGEADRKMLKAAIKRGAGEDHVRHRIVPSEAITKWTMKLDSLKSEIAEIMKEEREEKQRLGNNNTKAMTPRNSLPKARISRKAKRRKMAREEDEAVGDGKALNAAIRSAKKASRPSKIGLPDTASRHAKSKGAARKKSRVGFEKDLEQRNTEGTRAKKGDSIGGMGKKASKRRKLNHPTLCMNPPAARIRISSFWFRDKDGRIDWVSGKFKVLKYGKSKSGRIYKRLSMWRGVQMDGHEERVLLLDKVHSPISHAPRITGLWWTRDSRKQTGVPVADIFRRNNVIVVPYPSVIPMPMPTGRLDRFSALHPKDSTAA
ncbi:nucleolar DEAD-box protein required for synthesis of 60S ribosomal [Salix suchowensis]|nr:nucleolar DEAD-box protein required for synthesis of 60S ribosomal [Salix suchowensis]